MKAKSEFRRHFELVLTYSNENIINCVKNIRIYILTIC